MQLCLIILKILSQNMIFSWMDFSKSIIKQRKEKLRQWLIEYKEGLKCVKCGEDFSRALHFHHINPKDKIMEVSKMPHYGYSTDKMLEEINKCIVLCANCHAKEHASLV